MRNGKRLFAAFTLVMGLMLFAAPRAKAAVLYAVENQTGNLVQFDSSNPGTILSSHAIIGVQGGEQIRGIDFGANGVLYGLGSSSRLYTINPNTGQATGVGGQFSTLLNGSAFGMDVGGGAVRVVSDLSQSLSIDPGTGVATVLPPVNPAGTFLTALAFRSSTSTWFALDSSANTLGVFNPVTSAYSTIGLIGFDVARFNGFDISSSTGIAWLVSGASSSDVQGNLYRINLATGLATLVGLVGQVGDNTLFSGLTEFVAPEPGSLALLFTGAGVCAFLRRNARRR